MLHLAQSFRLIQFYEHESDKADGGQDKTRARGGAYLQLPENLRLPTGLEVLQSLGPEAVLLIQSAIATRRADESMTMQEPQHESSTAVSRLVLLRKAVLEMQFLGWVLENLLGKSLRYSHLSPLD